MKDQLQNSVSNLAYLHFIHSKLIVKSFFVVNDHQSSSFKIRSMAESSAVVKSVCLSALQASSTWATLLAPMSTLEYH